MFIDKYRKAVRHIAVQMFVVKRVIFLQLIPAFVLSFFVNWEVPKCYSIFHPVLFNFES